jgi:hypothetical protein
VALSHVDRPKLRKRGVYRFVRASDAALTPEEIGLALKWLELTPAEASALFGNDKSFFRYILPKSHPRHLRMSKGMSNLVRLAVLKPSLVEAVRQGEHLQIDFGDLRARILRRQAINDKTASRFERK